MKKAMVLLISFYQLLMSPLLKSILGVNGMCRHTLTCSEYAKQSIEKYGILRGSFLGIKRILRCQPFTSQSYYGKSV